jgi:hypothetical protein
MTAQELITASLRLIGGVAPGESLSVSEATDGLAALNRMIGSWSTESLLIHAKVKEELALVPSTATYTMGAGGTFSSVRPQRIEEAFIKVETTTPYAEYPINIVTSHEWANITDKNITSELPSKLYCDDAYPLATATLYPVPTTAHKLVLWSWKPITALAALTTTVSFPPGYERALIFNLALDLAPEYGRAVSDVVAMTAIESKAAIKRMNHKPRLLKSDYAQGGGSFDINTGDMS